MKRARRVGRAGCARLAVALAGCLAFACGGPEPEPSFILVSLDATRADHLGAYGYERDTTPFLDGLAERAFLFEQAVAPSVNTLISHATLLTGLPPRAHGATYEDGGRALHPAFTSVAEELSAHGYETGAFLAHGDWLNPRFGFDQGFGTFSSDYRSAELVLGEASTWLAGRAPGTPFFLFVHLYDVHNDYGDRPYEAPEPFAGRWAAGDVDLHGLNASDFLKAVNKGELEITDEEVERIRDQYDEGLAYTDDRLRRFFDGLSEASLERAWIFVVADHGEGFREHGKFLHASLHDEIVRIPFLVAPPPASPRAARVPVRIDRQVRLTDVRPTLLSLAGLPPGEHSMGEDLVPCLDDPQGRDCRSRPATIYRSALRHEGYKLIRARGGTFLYDLRQDPGETENLVGRPETRQLQFGMQRLLRKLSDGQSALHDQVLAGAELETVGQDAEAEQRLRALGYLD